MQGGRSEAGLVQAGELWLKAGWGQMKAGELWLKAGLA